ncbi:MAG: ArsB/NhaD family transporter [Candidatus Tritonobacter lacicola]|nr:ArsB/NhaD family transporter [Candidatus Tritonobacter lacicola]
MNPIAIACGIFIITYVAIATEKVHKAVAALLGAALMLILKVLDQRAAFGAVDLNVILLLAAMMVIVNILKKTGVFQWLAIKAAKATSGNALPLMAFLAVISALLSAFLDNVTAILLIVPVTLLLTEELRLDPIPFLIAEIMSSNIGGTATLIGDPPNIMIGSAAGIGFLSFLLNLGGLCILMQVALIIGLWLLFRKRLYVPNILRAKLREMDERRAITDRKLLWKCSFVLAGTLLGFIVHETLGLQPASIAIGGAAFLMLITKVSPDEALRDVEWSTLAFFTGLFIIVAGLDAVGVIRFLAEKALRLTGGNLALTSIFVLWFSGFASSFVDNIPYVATMIPIVKSLGSHMPVRPLWWCLAIGAGFGGNGTIIGASANVVVAGLAARSGYNISFARFLAYGLPFLVISLLISTLYVYILYL